MLFRFILLLILSGLVATATLWLVANPGYVNIDWMGWQIETTMQVLLLFLLSLFLLISLISALFRFVFSLGRNRSYAQLSKRVKEQERGLTVLIDALKEASDGKTHEGRRLASEAAQLLQSRELAKLLSPFMPLPPAEAKGNRKLPVEAKAWPVKEKLPPPEPAPKRVKEPVLEVPEVLAIDVAKLTELMQTEDWIGAEELINSAYPPQGKLPPAVIQLSANLLLAKAMTVASTAPDDALVLAKSAMQQGTTVILPASLIAADLLARQGHADEATALLRDVWHKHPAYPLLARCTELMAAETQEARFIRIESIVQGGQENPEGDLALGEAAIDTKAWGRARRHLIAAAKTQPSAKAYALLAKIEEQETGDEVAVSRWRHKEESASMDYAWHCRQCKAPSPSWALLCPACSAIGEMDWGLCTKPPVLPPQASLEAPIETVESTEEKPLSEAPA
jgi:HemY protein